MADMQELIARLEAAETGSLELDCEMGLFARTDGKGEVSDHFGTPCIRDAGGPYAPKPFTTSLDAALALAERVLPEWVYQIDIQSDLSWVLAAPDWWAPALGQGPEARGGQSSVAKTPALALCIAILKAKAQGEGG